MRDRTALVRRLRAALDRPAATELLRRAVAARSITGEEAAMARVLAPEMETLSLAPGVRDFAPGRPNVAGSREGQGPRLLFMGHHHDAIGAFAASMADFRDLKTDDTQHSRGGPP